uniref:Uncharacterized protein n=1 Tax=Anguilla anguilla TaxID=7936 RepID=A0A0E9QED7_ANGAN
MCFLTEFTEAGIILKGTRKLSLSSTKHLYLLFIYLFK